MGEDAEINGNGTIDYSEFLAATLDHRAVIKEDTCWEAFRTFDRNGDGHLSPDELKHALSDPELNQYVQPDVVERLMLDIDTNGDGVIDFQEFMMMMTMESDSSGIP